jgi:hypothetical protein
MKCVFTVGHFSVDINAVSTLSNWDYSIRNMNIVMEFFRFMMNNAGSIPPDFSIGSTKSMRVQCFDKLLGSEIVVQLHSKTKI